MSTGPRSSLLAIVDDDESVQSALQDLIESEGLSAHCFGSAEQFLDSTIRHDASCLIVDIRMPGMSGLELQTRLKADRCRIPIIFITARGDIPMTVHAMKGGAIDFLTKPVNAAALLNSIERAVQQHHANHQEAMEHEKFMARYETLTAREREVLVLLVRGLLNKQVAFEFGIAEYTVQIHRSHIMRKMEADSFATLVKLASKFILEPCTTERERPPAARPRPGSLTVQPSSRNM